MVSRAVRSAFNKDILRSVTGSLGRFLAIAGIVALGAGFYSGLRMTAPDMRVAADAFYDGTHLMDIRVVSSLGFSDEGLAALASIEGVEAVMPARETDVVGSVEGEQFAIRMHSLPAAAAESSCEDGVTVVSDDEDYLNRLVLADGRWPSSDNECVVSADSVTSAPFAIGDVITVTECSSGIEDTLAETELTIVGTVHASYYISLSSLGTTTVGSGTIQQVVYVPDGAFLADYPVTEAFVTVEGAAELSWGSEAYDEAVAEVVARIEEAADDIAASRTDEIISDAREELAEARSDYGAQRDDVLAQLADVKAELDEAYADLVSGEEELSSAQASLDSGRSELSTQLAEAESALGSQRMQLAEAEAALEEARPLIEAAREQLAAGFAAVGMGYEEARATLDALALQISEAEAQLAALVETRPEATEEIAALEAAIAAAEAQRDALSELVSGQEAVDAFDEQEAALASGKSQLSAAEASAAEQLARAQNQLASAESQISLSLAELDAGWASYDEGRVAYEESRAEIEAQLADAEAELAAAEAEIAALEAAQLYVLDRTHNVGAASFDADAGRVDSIASVFPFVFFLVAALVALTTMTRMVDEERILIGTYKALGLSRARIATKYLAYAAAASAAGSLVGIVVLSQILPWVIQYAYAIVYIVPILPAGKLPIDPFLAFLAAGIGIGVTLVATGAAATATLRERPAALMLPRAPKAGKRILLERVRPLWRRLSFSWKVTARNIFRYKKRFVMTVVGIAGCAALMLTGFGLNNAINDIIDNQFGRILVYDMTVATDGDLTEGERAAIDAELSVEDGVERAMWVLSESMSARSGASSVEADENASSDPSATLVVVSDPEDFASFVAMKPRTSDEAISMDEASVVVTEKLANTLGVEPGDELTLLEVDSIGNATGEAAVFTVTDVMENYIYNTVYVGPAAYEDAVGISPDYGSVYAVTSLTGAEREALADELRALSGVETVSFNDETIDTYRTMLDSVNIIVVVLIVAAAALAFIVLYNLTNINITERVREIATLKVLGFTPREVQAYIFRETAILTIIGALVGMPLGTVLEGFVVVTAEVDQVMFGRAIHLGSYLLAFLLALVFLVIVLLAMRRKLAGIDMVESLKSVD